MDAPSHTLRGEELGANALLDLMCFSGHNHQRAACCQGFAHAVVAPHAHDGVGSRHELEIVRVRQHPTPVRDPRLEEGLLLGWHKGPGHQEREQAREPGP